MAKTEKKQVFTLRLRPVLIKQIKDQAKLYGVKVGSMIERVIQFYYGGE